MLPTIVFGIALLLSVISTLSLIAKLAQEKGNAILELIIYIIAIIFWSWLFYLLH